MHVLLVLATLILNSHFLHLLHLAGFIRGTLELLEIHAALPEFVVLLLDGQNVGLLCDGLQEPEEGHEFLVGVILEGRQCDAVLRVQSVVLRVVLRNRNCE